MKRKITSLVHFLKPERHACAYVEFFLRKTFMNCRLNESSFASITISAIILFFFFYYYIGIRIIDNGASRRRTRNARFRARRADHSSYIIFVNQLLPKVFVTLWQYKSCQNKLGL